MRRTGVLLDLGRRRCRGPEVGHRRRHHHRVAVVEAREDGVAHLRRSLHLDPLDARRPTIGGGHQDDAGSAQQRGSSDGVAHFPARSIADETNRVEGLARPARADQDRVALEVTGGKEALDGADDLRRLGQPARPRVASRQPSHSRLDHVDAAPAQHVEVGPGRGVLPHLGVHCRRHHHRRARGQQRGGDEVVGDPGRVPPEDARRGGGHHHDIGGLPQTCVRDRVGPVPQARESGLVGQGREREGRDKAGGAVGQDGADAGAAVAQPSQDLHGLVGGDPSAHRQHHAATGERRHGSI